MVDTKRVCVREREVFLRPRKKSEKFVPGRVWNSAVVISRVYLSVDV